MQVSKAGENKWIVASYDCYLTNAASISDKDRVVAKEVYISSLDSTDDWVEISADEADKIRQAKGNLKIEIPESVNSMLNLMTTKINDMELTDEQTLEFKDLYPTWESFIGKSLTTGYKVQYNNALYRVRQEIATVLENQYPSIDTAALYEEINETAAGTQEDPIPYNNNMQLVEGKYYTQVNVVYYCNRSTGQAVYNDLKDLVNIYVNIVE